MIKSFDQSGITLDTDAEEPNIPTQERCPRIQASNTMAKRAAKKRI